MADENKTHGNPHLPFVVTGALMALVIVAGAVVWTLTALIYIDWYGVDYLGVSVMGLVPGVIIGLVGFRTLRDGSVSKITSQPAPHSIPIADGTEPGDDYAGVGPKKD